ncbi:hypothetical protein JCM19379_08430 [Methyloparacoccus murrellii]
MVLQDRQRPEPPAESLTEPGQGSAPRDRDGTRAEAGNALIWSGEDDPRDTLAPRLLACGADMRRLYFVGDVRDGDEELTFDPARHMDALTRAAARIGGWNKSSWRTTRGVRLAAGLGRGAAAGGRQRRRRAGSAQVRHLAAGLSRQRTQDRQG